MDGNLDVNFPTTGNPQPIDGAKVKNARRNLPPRPNLSESTHREAKEKLKEHNKETLNAINEDKVKLKKRQHLTKMEREDKVSLMMEKASCKIGIAPITRAQVNKACKTMTEKGILKKNEPQEIRTQRTLKS